MTIFRWFNNTFSYLTNKVNTDHPHIEKQGVKISKETYEIVKFMIMDVLRREKEVTNISLQQIVQVRLQSRFGKDAYWYYMVVRNDLEAKKDIEYVSSMSPHRVRLR